MTNKNELTNDSLKNDENDCIYDNKTGKLKPPCITFDGENTITISCYAPSFAFQFEIGKDILERFLKNPSIPIIDFRAKSFSDQ